MLKNLYVMMVGRYERSGGAISLDTEARNSLPSRLFGHGQPKQLTRSDGLKGQALSWSGRTQ